MSPSSAVVGLVLAGGRSVRFGGEKAVAELDGKIKTLNSDLEKLFDKW